MKIGIICNHFFGFPSISFLSSINVIAGYAVPQYQHPAILQIKQMATASNLPLIVLRKDNLAGDIKEWLKIINADLVLVYSFPFRIPNDVLLIPKLGFINFHPSRLPAYKGADPIFWQIKNGEKSSCVTAHMMNEKIDSGKIICREEELINETDTYGILENKIAFTTLRCTNKLVNIIMSYDLKTIAEEQICKSSSYFNKPMERDITISWNKYDSGTIKNLIKACNPRYQGALTFFRNIPVRIFEISTEIGAIHNGKPGQVLELIKDEQLLVASNDGLIININIVYVNEGCFSGSCFKKIFNIKPGELFFSPENDK